MVHPGGRPPIFETPEQLEQLIEEYFESCFQSVDRTDEDGNILSQVKIQIRPITLEGLAYHIGCDRTTIWNYSHNSEFYPIIKRARDRCQVSLAEHAMTAKNPAGAIWLGCNNYGYVNKSEISIASLPEQLSPADVKKQIEDRKRMKEITVEGLKLIGNGE